VRAVVLDEEGRPGLADVPRPEPEPGEVLVQVEVALTDGADAKAFRHGHSARLGELPSPLGHEFCGVSVASGQRVVAASSAPCGTCPPCRRGQEELCANLYPLLTGAYAEYVLVPAHIAERNLLLVPPGLASEVAAMVEPLACCLHGAERAAIEAGQTVAVLGLGAIGLMLCAAAKDAGANVVAVGGHPEHAELAPEFGAVPGDGRGADVVIETAGTEESWAEAVGLVRAGGTLIFLGGGERGTELAVDSFRLHSEELTLRGAFQHTPRTFRAALAFLASGAHPWERLVTHQVELDELAGLLEDPPADLLEAAVLP
jgi:L-iditol 2-dehydrogenase